jgi:hypothetical protein
LKSFVILTLSWLLFGSQAALADDYSWASMDYKYGLSNIDSFMNSHESDLVNPVYRALKRKAGGANPPPSSNGPSEKPAMRFPLSAPPVGLPIVPRALAKGYPAEKQADVEKVFNLLLNAHRGVEKQFGLPQYDMAGALAMYIAGSYCAYHNVSLPDETIKVLADQIRGLLSGTAAVSAAPQATSGR